jgi:hypothetical protein
MLTSTKTIAMNEDMNRTWYFCFHSIELTEDMKRESRIFALVQIREFDK